MTDLKREELLALDVPAFPQSLASEGPFGGMTLRDWFAGQALAIMPALIPGYQGTADGLAREAYTLADAMLLARASENSHEG